MSDYTLIHNPKCSKSRQTLELLNSKGIEPKILLYLEQELSEEFLFNVFRTLRVHPSKCLRKKEEDFMNLELDLEDFNAVVKAIIKFPKILERPIFIMGDKAVIGRPPENVLDLIS
jgi:arsenate reductase